MRKPALIICALLLIFPLLTAQTYKGKGRLTGFVTDEQGNPIEGVKVKLFSVRANAGFEVQTDKDGKWVAAWLRGGAWNIDFEKIGYEVKKISASVTEMGKKPPPLAITLKAVEGLVITDDLKEELNKGNALFDAEQYDEAIAVFSKMLEENPDIYILNKNIGNCYFQMEKYAEAEQYYLKILEQDPDDTDTMVLVGNTYANRGETDKALEWYNKIDFEQIKDVIVLYNIGTQFYNLSQFEDALKYYKRSVELQDDFLDGIYQLGLANLTMGNKDAAIAQFERYLELDPDSDRSTQVRGFLDYLKR